MDDYPERSARYTDTRLLDILREADKYHPEAVEAAQAEADRRGLQPEAFAFQATSEKSNILHRFRKMNSDGGGQEREDVLDWFGRTDPTNSLTLRYVYGLTALLVAIGFFSLASQLSYLRFVLFDDFAEPDWLDVGLILGGPLFLLATAFLVYRGIRLGYQVTAGLTGFSLLHLLSILVTMYLVNAELGYSVGELIFMDFSTFKNSLAIPLFLFFGLWWLVRHPKIIGFFGVTASYYPRFLLVGFLLNLLLHSLVRLLI